MIRSPFRRFRMPLGLATLAFATVAFLGAQAPQLSDKEVNQITARLVALIVENSHIAKPKIDDEISKRWVRNYLKALDPQKIYFLKADVEGFLKQETELDDKIKDGDIEFAKSVFDGFLKRAEEAQPWIQDFIAKDMDFSVDESIPDNPDKVDYPATDDVRKDRWRKRIKLDLLQYKVDDTPIEEARNKLTVRYRDRLRAFKQVNSNDLLEIYLTALLTSIDPHSSYMSPRTWEDMLQSLRLELEGIGASLASEDGYATIKEIVPGGAADKDGRLQIEDKVIGIVNAEGAEEDLVEKKLSDVVRKIRGPAGTKVNLIVQPAGTRERKVYELTRQKIELKEQHAKGKVIEQKADDGRMVKVGVINLPAFYGDTQAIFQGDPNAVSATLDTRKLLNEFKSQKVDAVLIDLRSNGGGLLQEAISLSGLFIDSGPVVQVRQASGVRHLDDDSGKAEWTGPMAVVIDKTSASASEIFAGVIRDYNRGLVIGDSSTFGKGTVQSIVPLNEQVRIKQPDLGALKLTIQQFYRANGESTQIEGVKPHIHIPSIRDQADFGEAKMDYALKFDKVTSLERDDFRMIDPELVTKLVQASLDRRGKDEKFQKQMEQIRKSIDRKKRESISLNEAQFRADFIPEEDMDEENPDHAKSKDKDKPRKRFAERPVWESEFYNDEVMRIVSDYVEALKTRDQAVKAAAR
jgi:carboxyl-terminal processing protease